MYGPGEQESYFLSSVIYTRRCLTHSSSALPVKLSPSLPLPILSSAPLLLPLLLSHRSLLAVGGVLWFQADGPGVGGDHVATATDPAGVGAFVELVGHDAQVPVLDNDVAWDGCGEELSILVPADFWGPSGIFRPAAEAHYLPPGDQLCLDVWRGRCGRGIILQRFKAEVTATRAVFLHEAPPPLTKAQSSPRITHPPFVLAAIEALDTPDVILRNAALSRVCGVGVHQCLGISGVPQTQGVANLMGSDLDQVIQPHTLFPAEA